MSIPRATLPLLAAGVAAMLAWACSSTPATVAGSGGSGGAKTSSHTHTTSTGAGGGGGFGGGGSGGDLPLTPTFVVSGVVTDGTSPVAGATVMQGGGDPAFTTGADGTFTITLTQAIPGTPTVVAAKLGYRAAGLEFLSLPTGPVELVLRYAAPPDNPSYGWGAPGNGNPVHDTTAYCGHCHVTFVKQFLGSTHDAAARDDFVQDLYAGVATAIATPAACQAVAGTWRDGLVPGAPGMTTSKCYVGVGVLPDLNPACGGGQLACDDPSLPAAQAPTAFGGCADCHAPGVGAGRSLHEAFGVNFDSGVHCDFCHHVRDVDLSKPAGVGGALMVQGPEEHVSDQPGAALLQVTYGPLPDVPNGFVGGSWQPKFSTSEYCGGCHEQTQQALVPGTALDATRWPAGLPTHSTYSEWAASSYNDPSTECQACHMLPDTSGLTNAVDVTKPADASIAFGFVRKPAQIRQHTFLGTLVGSPRIIDGALGLALTTKSNGTDLTVVAQVTNVKAGHAVPSGEPMRALVLVVDAQACGGRMAPSGGMSINDVGGAAAMGTVGSDVAVMGTSMAWASGALVAKQGDVVRVVRPTGTFDDYAGIGFFANPALTPAQKGLEIRTPVGEATVLSVSGGTLAIDAALAVQNGDLVYLGDALAGQVTDGDASRALAGRPGYTFARVLVDAKGARGVPHHRAVDMVSDNRIAPKASATTTHSFSIPAGCSAATITATLVFREVPVMLARERGWDATDAVVGTATASVALP